MADTATVREPRDLAPDLMGVKSRVSWSAIIGGTVIALACYIVLTLLLAAIGVSLTESRLRADPNAVGWGVLIAMIVTIVVSLWVGGWVASQLTVGENRQESVIYGLLVWGAMTAVSLFLVSVGVRAGYFAVVGGSVVAQNNERIPAWEDTARQAGVSESAINSAKSTIDPAKVRAEINDPARQEEARRAAITTAWVALVGTMLSMASAICGAMVGRGTAFRVFPVATRPDTGGPRLVVPTA